ncbi:MAG: hypothetical protein ACE5Q3_06865 [Alphaproteobacteria bacterium]
MLSLFLLLAAFFLMLSTVSRYEETRARAALGSLSATFGTVAPLGGELGSRPGPGAIVGIERFATKLDEILRITVGIDRYRLDRNGAILTATLRAADLFEPKSTKPRVGASMLARQVTQLVEPVASDGRAEVAIMSHHAREPWDVRAALSRARAAVLAADFARAGADAGHLWAGIAKGDPSDIVLVIRLLPAGEAAPTPISEGGE